MIIPIAYVLAFTLVLWTIYGLTPRARAERLYRIAMRDSQRYQDYMALPAGSNWSFQIATTLQRQATRSANAYEAALRLRRDVTKG